MKYTQKWRKFGNCLTFSPIYSIFRSVLNCFEICACFSCWLNNFRGIWTVRFGFWCCSGKYFGKMGVFQFFLYKYKKLWKYPLLKIKLKKNFSYDIFKNTKKKNFWFIKKLIHRKFVIIWIFFKFCIKFFKIFLKIFQLNWKINLKNSS